MKTEEISGEFSGYIEFPPMADLTSGTIHSNTAVMIHVHGRSEASVPGGNFSMVIMSEHQCLAIREDGSMIGSAKAVLRDIEASDAEVYSNWGTTAAMGILRALSK